jgi:NAD(P)H dehydrogenase (quinone)
LKGALATGQWVTSGGDGKVGYVTREDCAKIAAAALLKGGPTGTFDVTGSEALSPAEIAALASTATGKPLTVVQITEETQAEGMRAAHVPEMIVALATGIERLNREGGMSKISDTVERFTGQKPERLADYLAASKTALVA